MAERLWTALPLFSSAEVWGRALKFEADRYPVPFGPTPISGPGEIRLPHPSTALATTSEDPSLFATITPGQKVSIMRAEQYSTSGRQS
jgi:hypothetical protein